MPFKEIVPDCQPSQGGIIKLTDSQFKGQRFLNSSSNSRRQICIQEETGDNGVFLALLTFVMGLLVHSDTKPNMTNCLQASDTAEVVRHIMKTSEKRES